MTPQIFVCRDPMANAILDPLCDELTSWGLRVVRGPDPVPGTILDYESAQYAELFGEADIAMFSSRSRCTRGLLESAPRLRAVINPTIGVETVNLAAASELGIIVGNGATPENYMSMAEAAVMLMLNLVFDLRRTEEVLRKSQPKPPPGQIRARMLRGMTVGILGLGNIGRTVAQLLAPFGARLIACSPDVDPQSLPAGVELVDFATLMQQSDIVGVFVAITPENRQMINGDAIERMKPSAFIVNVARGDAIDEPALVDALRRRRIAGAALDTFAIEPLPVDSPLRQLDNVILTPHMVGQTRNLYDAIPKAAIENMRRVLNGQLPLYCKNAEIELKWRERLAQLPALDLPAAWRIPA
ncbi:2-hydroxyacid dehydrogenase [Variovorax ginsengisoli]|uniref:2-hydroxyacid dehydrogenase n=1 Tax=Variovorax ginsengisoli TaxID=363844 RepID=A0ABT8SD81_9BURK|nr:2-hydroxyacid dehydrogenase [Variovorax ginsengisoli]MDN8617515.1 2-hydroxyacid dehydrogenase [Variovorax ginsengisoli]MDO1536685.1 2-hydroxyacid dehydrogenase [Variovorax ginsengisoli]